MSTNAYDDILNRAKVRLTPEEQKKLAQELSKAAEQQNGSSDMAVITDPRDDRMGPATTDFTRRLRELRKQHLASGHKLLDIGQIDQLVAESQGSLFTKE